jgi:ribosomal protein S18 acetylase RimI-like enzyme
VELGWHSPAGFVSLRPAVAADVPDLEAIAKAAYLPYVPRMGFLPPPASADYASAVARGEVWLAAVAGGAAGLIVLVPEPGYLLLENVAVLPSTQGSGIGTGLLAFAEAQACELGLAEIRLYTNVAMTENQALYQRRGYVETHREVVGRLSRVYFKKRLL